MSATNDTPTPSEAAVIVFGIAQGAKLAQAGWFRNKDKDAATSTALKLGLTVLAVDSVPAKAILADLREVEIRPGEDPAIPVIDATLLRKIADAHREAAKETAGRHVPILGGSSDAMRPSRKLALWNALKVGDLVLAAELDRHGVPEGWYEAVITGVDGDTFFARFRDYPEDGIVKRLRHHIALLYSPG